MISDVNRLRTIMSSCVSDPVISLQVCAASCLHDDVLHVTPRQQPAQHNNYNCNYHNQ